MFFKRSGTNVPRVPPSSSTAFNKLPIEMNQTIAQYLKRDHDIANFRLICRVTRDAIDGDSESYWRKKFRESYAYNEGETNQQLKRKYQQRVKHLNRGVSMDFKYRGHKDSEIKVLDVLIELVVESYQGNVDYDEEGRPRCPNQLQIIKFLLNSKSFLGIKPLPSSSWRSKNIPSEPNPKLGAVQVMCAQLLFELENLKYDMFSFDDSQMMVYDTSINHPIFRDSSKECVNMEWTLHCLNFFRHHMVKEEALSLYETMVHLPVGEKPSAWRAPLKNGVNVMGKYWKGTYAYLEQEELKKIRGLSATNKSLYGTNFLFEDKNIDFGGKIQELQLEIVDGDSLPWPELFEDRLQSKPETFAPKTRAQHSRNKSASQDHSSFRLMGEGLDQDDRFFASGWLNPLPPQEGIPGWQRITLMKHFDQDYSQAHHDDLWAYEGVVLPGGRVVIGRWWFANDHPAQDGYFEYSGPFIFWAVDSPTLRNDSDSDFEYD